MIHYSTAGRLGNQLFNIAAALLRQKATGEDIAGEPIELFPITKTFVRGARLQSGEKRFVCDRNVLEIYDNAEFIREKLHPLPGNFFETQTLVMHLRTGDALQKQSHRYDVNEVIEIAMRIDRNLIAVTESYDDPIARDVRCYGVPMFAGCRDVDFRTLLNAKRLFLTPSTFGWWAAFLGCAEEIYYPSGMGCFRDLPMPPEPRYIDYGGTKV